MEYHFCWEWPLMNQLGHPCVWDSHECMGATLRSSTLRWLAKAFQCSSLIGYFMLIFWPQLSQKVQLRETLTGMVWTRLAYTLHLGFQSNRGIAIVEQMSAQDGESLQMWESSRIPLLDIARWSCDVLGLWRSVLYQILNTCNTWICTLLHFYLHIHLHNSLDTSD